jgi:hypothetical protein
VLNGALHHSDYITKVMKRLTDPGMFPKVVLESALHLSDYVTMVTKWLGDQGVFPKVVIESVLSLDYYLSYDYCLHPFPPSKQANPPQIEANNTETNKLYCLSDTLTQTEEKVPKTVRSSLIQLLKVLALSSTGDQRQRLQR